MAATEQGKASPTPRQLGSKLELARDLGLPFGGPASAALIFLEQPRALDAAGSLIVRWEAALLAGDGDELGRIVELEFQLLERAAAARPASSRSLVGPLAAVAA